MRDRIGEAIEARIAHAVTDHKYGIEIISADIRRADFSHQVRSSIIDWLWAERECFAALHRAEGGGGVPEAHGGCSETGRHTDRGGRA